MSELRDMRRGVLNNTKAVEDSARRLRQVEQNQPTNKVAPQAMFWKLINSTVLHVEHDFEPVEGWFSNHLVKSAKPVTRHHFKGDIKQANSGRFQFDRIMDGGPSPPWHTMTADAVGHLVSDLAIAEEMHRTMRFIEAHKAHAIQFLARGAHMMFERKGRKQWLICIGNLGNSAVCLPLMADEDDWHHNPTAPAMWHFPVDDFNLNDLIMHTCFDLKDFRAMPIVWKSPVSEMLAGVPVEKATVQLYSGTLPQDPLELAARECFWDITNVDLKMICRQYQIEVESSWTLFQVCRKMLSVLLPGNGPEENIEIFKKRFKAMGKDVSKVVAEGATVVGGQ